MPLLQSILLPFGTFTFVIVLPVKIEIAPNRTGLHELLSTLSKSNWFKSFKLVNPKPWTFALLRWASSISGRKIPYSLDFISRVTIPPMAQYGYCPTIFDQYSTPTALVPDNNRLFVG